MVGVDPAGHGGGRLRRHPDADPLEADARGRARLPRPVAPAAGPLLCAAAVAADRQAAARDQRASSATTRSRSASATRISVPTACRRSRSSTSRWRSRTWSSCSALMETMVVDRLARVRRRRARDAVRPDDVRRGRPALRLGQARPALRPRDRGRDASHARLRVRRVRRRGGGAVPARAAEYSRSELAELEEFAKQWGAKGLAYLVYDESGEVRSPIAKFLSEGELAAFARSPGRRCSSRRDDGR